MRAVFGLVLIVGVALAGGAVYLAKNYISAYQTALAAEKSKNENAVQTVTVFVAKRPLRYGESLKKEDVRLIYWPENSVPEGVYTEPDKLFPPNTDKWRYVMRAMEKGEPILEVKVTKPGEPAGLTARLDPGMRAFTIKVDVATGVSGFLRPDHHVDVYWTGRVDQGDRGNVTRLIQQGVKLIAVDQQASDDLEGTVIARTVTVAATPQQVAALAQAQNSGRLSLALVGSADETEIGQVIEVDQHALLGTEASKPAPRAEEERECTIRTRRGAEVVEIPIPCSE